MEKLETVERAYAGLSRAAWGVLDLHRKGDVLGLMAVRYSALKDGVSRRSLMMNVLHHELRSKGEHCECDPPGSGEEWCTGHCEHMQ